MRRHARLKEITNKFLRSIAAAQLLNIPITVCGLLFIAITGIFADRSRIPRPVYPLSFLVVILVCYGVFIAYPGPGAVFAVTLIGNALKAGWYPVMWYGILPLPLSSHRTNVAIGRGVSKPPPAQQALPSRSDSSTATVKSEVLSVHKCLGASMLHTTQFHLLQPWRLLVFVAF